MHISIMPQSKLNYLSLATSFFFGLCGGTVLATCALRGTFVKGLPLIAMIAVPTATATYVVARNQAAKRESELEEDVAVHLGQILDLSEESREVIHQLYEAKEELANTRQMLTDCLAGRQLDQESICALQDRESLLCRRLEEAAEDSAALTQALQTALKALEVEPILPPPIGWPLAH